MTDPGSRDNFFNAAKILADSEIELMTIIENSGRKSQRQIKKDDTMSKAARKNETKGGSTENSKIKPSPALMAAKREAAHKKQSESKKLDNFFVRDIYQTAIDAKTMIRGDTGLTYERSMAEHRCIWDENYPECPERFTRVLERCRELGLTERCKFVEPRTARNDEILLQHAQSQIDILRATDGLENAETLEKLSSQYDAIYIHPSTYKLSLLATGSTINLLENICRGKVQNGMAIIRPPGHHAMKSEYCGYCFFNNVAIGAEKMLRSNMASRILIVDWDVHHGQATQQMFYDDPRVVYFSIHRYENGEFWPNLRESDYHYVGENAGAGFNFNVPLNKNGMTNGDYLAIFQQLLLPMAYEFQPDLVIVSAGFDCALGCPEGEMEVTPGFFPHLLSSLMAVANGRIAVVLEGGYCLDSLAESAALTLRTLLGDPCPIYKDLEAPSETIRDTILNVIYAHRSYWKCYQYQESYSINSESENCEENSNRHLPAVIYNGDGTKPDHYETRNCYPIQSETVLRELKNRLMALKQATNLNKAAQRVCIVYDERMLKHRELSDDDSHPERPIRISGIFAKHEEYDLIGRCRRLDGREATEEELLLAHTSSYINDMRETCSAKNDELRKMGDKFNSVFLHNDTWTSACVAAGSVLQVVDSVMNGESQSGVAIVRPPGHHADDETACGFCIFNNVAIAARYATRYHNLKRVLIVDWDIHHGNGTQTILAEEPNILYISIHRYDNGGFFPNSKEANYTFVGTDRGEGFNVNIPWNRKRMGDAEYIAAFQQIVMPIAYQFNPELVLISAGFDACVGDPLGGYTVSPETYGHLTHWLSSLANGRVVIALEGGYNVNSISYAMTMCTKALLGDPMPSLGAYQQPCSSAVVTIKNVLKTQRRYWQNLSFQMALPKENILPEAKIMTEKLNEVASPLSETKIAFEEIENEKLEMSLLERERLDTITADEMAELQREIERMAIIKVARECINPEQKDFSGRKDPSNAGASGSGENLEVGEATGGTNPSLLDYLSDNLQALVQGEMFAIVPLRECPHLSTVEDVPANGINVRDPCQECNSTAENWICLRCYTVHCARSINQHAVDHGQMAEHPMTLSFSDLSVWCYGCEAYIDNPRLYAARNAAHLSKFNHELPWTYNNDDSANVRE